MAGSLRVLLTGATGSLGRATAAALRARDVHVTAAVRRPGAASGLADEIVALDLADLASVASFPERLEGTFDAVILNAGLQFPDRTRSTAQGYEEAFGVNVVANALLADALRERTERIVLVASGTHRRARMRNLGYPPPRWQPLDVLAVPGAGSGQVAYATSKLALVLFGLEAARRWSTDVVLVDPGLMPGTGLAREYPPVQRWMWNHVLPRVLPTSRGGVSTPERSGEALAAVTLDPSIATGRYLQIGTPKRPDRAALDQTLAAEVFNWAVAPARLRGPGT